MRDQDKKPLGMALAIIATATVSIIGHALYASNENERVTNDNERMTEAFARANVTDSQRELIKVAIKENSCADLQYAQVCEQIKADIDLRMK